MAELWFYQLKLDPLEHVLPLLLQRALEREWRIVIETPLEDRLALLDDWLWTYKEDSFLPHGSSRDGFAELQPVWLTQGTDRPNQAHLRFLLDGADPRPALEASPAYERLILLFEGHSPDQAAPYRQLWTELKTEGYTLSYWQQEEKTKRWIKM